MVIGLANCERAVRRMAGLGDLTGGSPCASGPQERRWTTSFSSSLAGAAWAVGLAIHPSRPRPEEEITASDVGSLSLRMPYRV